MSVLSVCDRVHAHTHTRTHTHNLQTCINPKPQGIVLQVFCFKTYDDVFTFIPDRPEHGRTIQKWQSIRSRSLSLSLSLDQATIQITHNTKIKRFSTTNNMSVRFLSIHCCFLSYFVNMLMIYALNIKRGSKL